MNAQRLIIVALTLIGMLAGRSSFSQEDWRLAKDAEGIKVYVRNVPGSSLREFRGEISLDVPVDKVVAVLRDANAFVKWMPDVAASELLSINDSEQFHYLDNKAPWPVANRDGVYHFVYGRSEDGTVIVRVNAVPGYVPLREGKVRIPQADGQWVISPAAEGVRVRYQMHASPGGSIPGWVANQAVVDTPYGTLKAMRDYLQAR